MQWHKYIYFFTIFFLKIENFCYYIMYIIISIALIELVKAIYNK